jgi:hypothetical protein
MEGGNTIRKKELERGKGEKWIGEVRPRFDDTWSYDLDSLIDHMGAAFRHTEEKRRKRAVLVGWVSSVHFIQNSTLTYHIPLSEIP